MWASAFLITLATMPFALTKNCTEPSMDIVGNVVTEIYNEVKDYTPYLERLETYILPVVLLIIVIFGLTGNGVIVIAMMRNKETRTIPNTYLLSLALGDILVLVLYVPFVIMIYALDSWPFGISLCKIAECAKDVSVGVSIFTLTALSVDRHFAIVHSMKKHRMTGEKRRMRLTLIIIAVLWFLATLLATPAMFSYTRIFKVHRNMSFYACYPFPEEFGSGYPQAMVVCRFIVYYAIPFVVIAVFYVSMARHLLHSAKTIPGESQGQMKQIQSRKKTAKMVMAFVIIFFICFLPQHVFMLWFYFHPTSERDYDAFWHYFRTVGLCLPLLNSCANPIGLYYMSTTFRVHFNKYLCCFKRIRRTSPRHQEYNQARSRGQSDKEGRIRRLSARLSIKTRSARNAPANGSKETAVELCTCLNNVKQNKRVLIESAVEVLSDKETLI